MPDLTVAPVRVVAVIVEPDGDGWRWTVTVDDVAVNSAVELSGTAAVTTGDLVAVSVLSALTAVGLPGRIAPTL